MKIGYFLSSEEWGPRELISQAAKAKEAGFEGLWISDHFHPWNDKQDHSPFVWSTIGGIAQAAPGMKVTTAVTCPTMRIHPAIIAHAAATGPDADSVSQFRNAAQRGTLVQGGLKVCWSDDKAKARHTVHELWFNEGLPGELAQVLPTPEHFEQAGELVTEELATDGTPCGPDVEEHVSTIRAYEEAGFDELYINQIGPEQDAFFEAYRDHVLPRVR